MQEVYEDYNTVYSGKRCRNCYHWRWNEITLKQSD